MNTCRIIELRDSIANYGLIDMGSWQSNGLYETVEEHHACGNTACIAGHMAMLPAFQKDEGWVGANGRPEIDGVRGSAAASVWLGLPLELCQELFGGFKGGLRKHAELLVGERWELWNSYHAVKLLNLILEGTIKC